MNLLRPLFALVPFVLASFTTAPAHAAVLAAGYGYTCAVAADATVACWGNNDNGQLGDGTTTNRSIAAPVSGIVGATAVSAGQYHACALVAGGAVKCWGANDSGQLGNGATQASTTPVDVTGLVGATAIAAGENHTCALVADGAVKCWGSNHDHQLGDGGAQDSATPVAVSGLAGATAIAAGGSHTCALVADGTVQCWGYNFSGQLGDGTTVTPLVPVGVVGLGAPAQALVAGYGHTCAVLTDGSAKCWGSNDYGQLGDGTIVSRRTPVAVEGLDSAIVALGSGPQAAHVCAALAGGTTWCWGYGADGNLGNGATQNSAVPVAVSGLAEVAELAGGRAHTCAATVDEHVWCWGDDFYGELGDGTTTDSPTPVAALGLVVRGDAIFRDGFDG